MHDLRPDDPLAIAVCSMSTSLGRLTTASSDVKPAGPPRALTFTGHLYVEFRWAISMRSDCRKRARKVVRDEWCQSQLAAAVSMDDLSLPDHERALGKGKLGTCRERQSDPVPALPESVTSDGSPPTSIKTTNSSSSSPPLLLSSLQLTTAPPLSCHPKSTPNHSHSHPHHEVFRHSRTRWPCRLCCCRTHE